MTTGRIQVNGVYIRHLLNRKLSARNKRFVYYWAFSLIKAVLLWPLPVSNGSNNIDFYWH